MVWNLTFVKGERSDDWVRYTQNVKILFLCDMHAQKSHTQFHLKIDDLDLIPLVGILLLMSVMSQCHVCWSNSFFCKNKFIYMKLYVHKTYRNNDSLLVLVINIQMIKQDIFCNSEKVMKVIRVSWEIQIK